MCGKGKKNIIVSCLYRAPGSSIELFKDWIENMFSKSLHKSLFICGDYNIDLLNPKKHQMTEDFINTMYSMGLYPKITNINQLV